MSTRGLTRFRLAGAGVACAIVAVVLLTGWGLFVSTTQEQDIERVLFFAAKADAERYLGAIERGIVELENEVLDAIALAVTTGRGPAQPFSGGLHELEHRFDVLHVPIVLSASYQFVYPPIDTRPEQEDSPLLIDESAPDDYLQAMRLVWTNAPSTGALRALESVHRAPEMAARWRFRAVAAKASVLLRSGDPSGAVAAFEQIEDEFAEEIGNRSTRPSRLHVVMAHAEALRASGRGDEAVGLLLATLQDVIETRIAPVSVDEELFFVERVRGWDGVSSAPIAERRSALLDFHRERLEFLASTRGLAEWKAIPPRIRLGLESSGEETSGHLSIVRDGKPRLVAWRAIRSVDDKPVIGAVGFEARTDALCREVERLLADALADSKPENAGSFTYRASSGNGFDSSDVPFVELPDALSLVRVSVDPESWRERLARARRPYRLATVLIPTLGLTMVMALVMFYLGYRRERHLSDIKTDFVANVSHELKTPLALIRLFGETLSLGRVPSETKKHEYYEIITRESERLTLLINNVLDFASIEAEKKSYEFVPTDVGCATRNTLQTYRYHLEESGFAVELDIEEGLPRCLVDPDALSQALINLLNNAVKYSDESKEISVRVFSRENRREVHIEVEDRGVGISSDDRRRIFEGFYRADAARKLGRRGSGLGLTLVLHIMRAHAGRVDVRSELDKGSVFTVVLPALADPDRTSTEDR